MCIRDSDWNISSLVEITNWSSLCFICFQSGQHSLRLIISSLCQRLTSHIILALTVKHTATLYTVVKKTCHFYFSNSFMNHWPILITFGMCHIRKKLDANDWSFGHLASILSLHYPVKIRSCTLAIYNNEFRLDIACVGTGIINWKATNTIGTYCIQKIHTCHITYSLLQHALIMSSSSVNASGKCWHHPQTAGSTTCISQGSVATVLKWGGQKYSHLRQASSWCCMPKIIKIGQCCTELFKK